MNNFHRFQNFRQFSNLFSQIRLKKRHTSLFSGICREIRTKFHQKFAEKMKIRYRKRKKIGNSFFIREKMLTIFGWNFEIWAVQKNVNLVDLVKSFPTSLYLQRSASMQPRTSPAKFRSPISQITYLDNMPNVLDNYAALAPDPLRTVLEMGYALNDVLRRAARNRGLRIRNLVYASSHSWVANKDWGWI